MSDSDCLVDLELKSNPVVSNDVRKEPTVADCALGEEVSSVSFVAPKYEEDATLWFRQLEARFEASRIRSQSTRYYIAFGNLPGVLLKPVVASIGDPKHTDRPYDHLKNVVLSREQLSVTQRVDQVLKDISMGDRKPADYFAHLKEIAGDSFSEEAVFQIWLSRMPTTIKTTLIVLKNESLNYRLEIADELFVAHGGQGQVAAVNRKEENWESLKKELLKEMKDFMKEELRANAHRGRDQSRGRNRGNVRNRSRARSKSTGKEKKDHEFCWYHFKFGDKAAKCSSETCKFEDKKN